ncbi:NACHT domain-containing protein [Mycobacterium sp.]|uniref:NACHT domain-containing protein n=1 Tax=Mycobacterium sp. TaxID=1785 RepID=UPI002D1242EB|nr:NACHT domain-containing protein [Mycobacterium sp.]HKP39794.1 NACHT domain-containing protein [Mycobacterium sp.]
MPIRIVARDTNDQGDLLSRLARDLFLALGYENCRVNVHKTGREIDLMAVHRYESREVIAEMKSGIAPIGGADINKFVGVLDGHRRKSSGKEVHGYYISLAGYRETAIEQERELGGSRVTLLDGQRVKEELINCKLVVTAAEAALAAKDLIPPDSQFEVDPDPDLVGHSIGWIWAVYVTEQRERTRICFIHADGSPLSLSAANQVIATARTSDDPIATLRLLNKNTKPKDAALVARRYQSFILQEFGGITLEGLPADQSVGSRQFKLEDLYVPLRLKEGSSKTRNVTATADEVLPSELETEVTTPNTGTSETSSQTLGEVISQHAHVAILGLPGSGKSTALKRLAVAYADKQRLHDSDDGLPDESWFPVVIRCRHLANRSRDPILQVIVDQVERAEMPELRESFANIVARKLQDGDLLLLIDGLDEIPSASDRLAFVSQLRTFIGVYPTCRLVVTSREAGFRSVAAAVNSICHRTMVSGLSDDAIRSLVTSWRKEVIGPSDYIQSQAESLADDIIANDRLRSLATNPLLLTTLLLVQRWIGQLPRRRTVLYQKAIEVLLMTWNAEGHQPLDPDEALPQLAYTAYSMMSRGVTSVTSEELANLLMAARRDLPEVLSYAQMSTREFVDRVEERSSLMTLSGHQVVNGKLEATYEFKHLTFQEYLAALGIANGWIDSESRGLDIVNILEERFGSETWQEVVGLTTVLSGSRAGTVVETLISRLRPAVAGNGGQRGTASDSVPFEQLHANLVGCLRDEAAITPELAEEAIELCIRATQPLAVAESVLCKSLHGGRYDSLLRKISYAYFTLDDEEIPGFGSAIANIALADSESRQRISDTVNWVSENIHSGDSARQITGSLTLMALAYNAAAEEHSEESNDAAAPLLPLVDAIVDQLLTNPIRRNALTYAMMWALVWGLPLNGREVIPSKENALQLRIVEIWAGSRKTHLSRQAAWALTSTSLVGEWELTDQRRLQLSDLAKKEFNARGESSEFRKSGALFIRRYIEDDRTRTELIKDIIKYYQGSGRYHGDAERLLNGLGDEGKRALAELKN